MFDHQPIHRSLILSLHGCMPQGTTALHLAGMCRHLIGSDTRRAYRALDQLVRQRLVSSDN